MKKFFQFTLPIICLAACPVLFFVGVLMDESLKKVYTTWPVYSLSVACIVYYSFAWAMGWFKKKYK